MLDLNEIAVFVEVARAGSFAEAGRHLGMPPPTVGRYVQKLETQLGTRLMQRSTRKLRLTEAGQVFFDRCAASVTALAQAGQDLVISNETPSGLIRVAAPAGFFDAFSVDWVSEFLALYPQVNLEFVLSDEPADLIAQGIDVDFRAGLPLHPDSVARKFLTQRFILVASPAYIQKNGTPANFRALATHDCLIQTTKSGTPPVWRLNGTGDLKVSARFAANTSRAILRAAVAGLGIAMLAEVVVAPNLRAGRLIRVLPHIAREAGDVYVVLPSRKQVPRAVSAFVRYAATKLASDEMRLDLVPEEQ